MPLDTTDPLAVRRTGARLMITFGVTIVGAFLVVAAPAGALTSRLALTSTQQIVLVALVCGALGGSIHVATSFADYVGSGMYDPRWLWWYALRPLIGAGLALIFLAVMQAGWLPILSTDPAKQLWGAAAVSGLVGLFSKQAVDKLSDVFDAILKTDKDSRRKDSLESQSSALTLTAVTPDAVAAGSGAQTVVVKGTAIPEKPLVRFSGKERPAATDAARTSLQVSLAAEDVATPGNYEITVSDSTGGPTAPAASIPFGVKVNVGPGVIVDGSQAATGASGAGAAVGGANGNGAAQAGGAGAADAAAEHPLQVPDEDESGGEANAAPQKPRAGQVPVGAGAGGTASEEAFG